jgi:hypothetical protein
MAGPPKGKGGKKKFRSSWGKFRRNGNGNGATRAQGTRVLAQGAAAGPNRAYGTQTKKQQIPRQLVPDNCWNAFDSCHAGLPRAVGPYSVVRTTTLITTKSPLLIFGTYSLQDNDYAAATTMQLGKGYGNKMWTNIACVGYAASGSPADFVNMPINDYVGNVTELHTIPVPGAATNGVFVADYDSEPLFLRERCNTTCVPSAMSVQVINPTQVMSADGTAIAAVCPVRLDLSGSNKSWKTIGDEIVSYFRPRVLTGGKLALRGVQMNSHPLSMSDVGDFRPPYRVDPLIAAPSKFTWAEGASLQSIATPGAMSDADMTFPITFHPEGWAPMVYYSPSNAVLEEHLRTQMTFLVTTEWRVRFDISNPAASSHTMHPITTDNSWHSAIDQVTKTLPGVIDIVEQVANAGIRIARVARMVPK